jgi:hypothetical protein
MPDSLQQDALQRLNTWLDALDKQTRHLLMCIMPEELTPLQAAGMAGKYLTLLLRVLQLRQQFANDAGLNNEEMLRIIMGEPHENGFTEIEE